MSLEAEGSQNDLKKTLFTPFVSLYALELSNYV